MIKKKSAYTFREFYFYPVCHYCSDSRRECIDWFVCVGLCRLLISCDLKMPIENLDEEGLERNPNLELAQVKYLLSIPENADCIEYIDQVMEAIKKDDMAPWYELICDELEWELNDNLYKQMKKKNDIVIKQLDEVIEDAEKNLGEMEVRDAYLKKAEYYSRIGDKENALSFFRQTYDKTVSLGHRLDIVFHKIRLGLFFMDYLMVNNDIDHAKALIEEGGDWDRRNRLKVYQGVFSIAVRDFRSACFLFLDTVSTFTSYELMDYVTFVRYTVYLAAFVLPRNHLRDKIIRGSEILEVLHSIPDVKSYIFSLYNCQYSEFFIHLSRVEEIMQHDYLFHPHFHYYVREMKIIAYTQLLESYRSLTLAYMSDQFGVTVDYMDEELSRFIACGRLHCQIDRVGGVVETNRPDSKNAQFQAVLKQGDLLLNRVQKLSRVINV